MKGEFAQNPWRKEIEFCQDQDQLAYRVPPGLSCGEGATAPYSSVSEGQDQCSWSPWGPLGLKAQSIHCTNYQTMGFSLILSRDSILSI